MATGALSNQVVSEWLAGLGARGRYVSLHFALPDWADPGASEVFDPGYSRAAASWAVESNRSISNATAMQFNVALETNIVALGLRTDLTSTELLAYAVPPPGFPIEIPTTGLLTLPIGEVVFGL